MFQMKEIKVEGERGGGILCIIFTHSFIYKNVTAYLYTSNK